VEEPVDKQIAALAKRNRGYITRSQLIKLGLGAEAIRYRVRIGRLIPVYAGVYAVGHLPTLPQDRAFGALLACGPDAVLSHGSAASLWGIFGHWRMPFEVTTPSTRRPRNIRTHRAKLARPDITRQAGIQVTSPARTLLDMAPRLTDKQLTRAVNDLRRRCMHLHELADVISRFPRHPGAKKLRRFIVNPTGPTRSEFEDAFLAFAERFGLPRPRVNEPIGRYIADALFVEERLIVELDGWPFHSSKDSFESDRERDAEMLARGYATVRITWARLLGTPKREADRLLAILRARRSSRRAA
jgi:very-short-patch-repair endonuclease